MLNNNNNNNIIRKKKYTSKDIDKHIKFLENNNNNDIFNPKKDNILRFRIFYGSLLTDGTLYNNTKYFEIKTQLILFYSNLILKYSDYIPNVDFIVFFTNNSAKFILNNYKNNIQFIPIFFTHIININEVLLLSILKKQNIFYSAPYSFLNIIKTIIVHYIHIFHFIKNNIIKYYYWVV